MAASILAKVSRDRAMVTLHQQWPQYGFNLHKGYCTPAHLAAHGPCPHHRLSFATVRAAEIGNAGKPSRSAVGEVLFTHGRCADRTIA